MKRHIINRILAMVLVAGIFVIDIDEANPKAMEVKQDIQNQNLSVSELDDTVSSVKSNDYNLPEKVKGGAILHAWCWSAKAIISQLPDIAAAGYTAIQTIPCNNIIPSEGEGVDKWWTQYQPTKLEIGNYMIGSKEDFTELCTKAHEYGIKIIVDVVPNHTADYCHDSQIDPALKQFWRGNRRGISNYNDRKDCTQNDACGSLADMNTENKDYQKMFIEYLNKLIACGCDGFRYDTAKHIAVPEDSINGCGSDFWPTVMGSSVNDINNKFVYAEVLQDTYVMYDSYAKYVNLTANWYSATVRDKLRSNGTMDVSQISNYNSQGAPLDKLVVWAESHDTFANNPNDDKYNESSWASQANIRMVWAFIAARKDGTCLFYARPKGADGNHNRFPGQNKLGEVGSEEFKAPEVAAVNNFRNAMIGESEYLRNPNGNTKIAMVERGKKGVVIINLGGATELSSETTLEDGTYKDQVSGRDFTVSGGKISGHLDEYKVAVVYNAKPSTAAKVSASVSSRSFTEDGISVTLNTSNTKKATYSINGEDETEFTDGTKVTIGKGANPGDKFTLKLKGIANEGDDASETYTYTKKDPNAANIAYLKLPAGWDKAYAYVYNDDPTAPKGSAVKENAAWPGVEMTKVSDGLYKYEMPGEDEGYDNPLIIFTNGVKEGTKKYPADTATQVDAEGLKCEGSMICDGTSWKEYDDPNKTDDKKELTVTLTSDETKIELDSSVKLTAKATGGSEDYTYTFKVDGEEIYSGSKSSFEWTPDKAGDYKVTVEVNDGDTTKESDELDITVSDDTEKPKELSISLSADKSGNQQVNTKIKFTAKVVGGSGDYNYTFKINDKKIDNGDSSTYTWTPKTSGEYTISVTVDDGKETKTSSQKTFNIVDEQNSEEGDNNSLYGLLLAGTFGATLLGALRRKRNM
ncbi:MAG: alpha-amylase family glycosyl hydrolase [Clostridiales bacterium]|nr:alpha-amylase family glycosyl hydrolase [Clostridiales bacterium]